MWTGGGFLIITCQSRWERKLKPFARAQIKAKRSVFRYCIRFLRWNSVKLGRLVRNTLLTRLSGRSIGRIFHRGKSKRFTKIEKLFNNFERTGWKANVQTVFKTYHAQRRKWFTLWRHLSWIMYRAYLIGLFSKPEIMKVFYWKSILFTTIVLYAWCYQDGFVVIQLEPFCGFSSDHAKDETKFKTRWNHRGGSSALLLTSPRYLAVVNRFRVTWSEWKGCLIWAG